MVCVMCTFFSPWGRLWWKPFMNVLPPWHCKKNPAKRSDLWLSDQHYRGREQEARLSALCISHFQLTSITFIFEDKKKLGLIPFFRFFLVWRILKISLVITFFMSKMYSYRIRRVASICIGIDYIVCMFSENRNPPSEFAFNSIPVDIVSWITDRYIIHMYVCLWICSILQYKSSLENCSSMCFGLIVSASISTLLGS